MNPQHDIRTRVMDAIQSGKVQMRPRWHFVLLSALLALGVLLSALVLLYTSSLVVFFLSHSGALALTEFGGRGWWDFLQSLPLSILFLTLAFIVVLEVLVRRYSFGYKKPLLTTLLGIVVLVMLGGFFVSQTSLHALLTALDRHGRLPPPMGGLYKPPPGGPDDVYRGLIVGSTTGGLIVVDRRNGTTSVLIGPRTRFPAGSDFAHGDFIMVIGDWEATGTVRAYGVREIERDFWMEANEREAPPGLY